MFCTKCGKQLPDGTKFCTGCGASLAGENAAPAPQQEPISQAPQFQQPAPQQEPIPQAPQFQQPAPQFQQPMYQAQPAPKKKSKAGIIVLAVIAALVLVFVIAGIAAGFGGSDSDASGNSSDPVFIPPENPGNASDNIGGGNDTPTFTTSAPTTTTTAPTSTANPAYQAIFEGTNILHYQMFLGMDTAYFAKKNDDGTIYCSDYGYKLDIVQKLVETIYVPVDGYSDAQKSALENANRTQFAKFENLSCCEVKYNMGPKYFTITVTYNNLNDKDSCSELYSAGILNMNSLVSMSKSEAGMVSKGYVKK